MDVDNTSNNIYARIYNDSNIRNRNNNSNSNRRNSNRGNANNNYNNNYNNNNNNFNNLNINNQFDGIQILRYRRNNQHGIDENWTGEGLESRWDN